MNFFSNITLRKKGNKRDPNTSNISQVSSDTFEDSVTDLTSDTSLHEENISNYKQKIDQLELRLTEALQQIESLTLENSTLKQVNNELTKKNDTSKTKPKTTPIKETQITIRNIDRLLSEENCIKKPPLLHTNTQNSKTKPTNHKINILSTNKTNKILSISEKTFSEDYKICHYLMPNRNISQLISNIGTKIQDLTMHDFCVIMIGEEDFRRTSDYLTMVSNLRETLRTVKHTNVIICSPTFKYEYTANLYNSRVEYFNNLLYLDILENEYAFFLDSNKSLECSYDMFNRQTGAVNNYGMKEIFNDIKRCIIDILSYEAQAMDDVVSEDHQHSPDENDRCQPSETEENNFFRL